MDINRHNYEAFLLDLLEGRLSAEEERQLNEFLKNHPELGADMPDLTLCCLEKDKVSFPGRDQLRKDISLVGTSLSEANFDLFSIARLEGDLSRSQEEEHQSMVDREPVKMEQWSAWQKTRLVPGQIQFHFLQEDVVLDLEKRCLMRLKDRVWQKTDDPLLELVTVMYLINVTDIYPIGRDIVGVKDLKEGHFF